MCDGLLHDTGTLDHLRQKHFALAKQITDDVHAVHERTFDDVQWSTPVVGDGLPHFFGVLNDEFVDAAHQGVTEAGAHV